MNENARENAVKYVKDHVLRKMSVKHGIMKHHPDGWFQSFNPTHQNGDFGDGFTIALPV